MTTLTCDVCGSDVGDAAGTTCPVCGADLPTAAVGDEPDPAGPGEPHDAAADASADTDQPPSAAGDPGEHWAGTTHPPGPEGPPKTGPGTTPPPPPGGWGPPPPPTYAYRRPTEDPYHPSGLAQWVRSWGLMTHLSTFLALFIGLPFLGPLVMWLIRREEHPFLDHHGKEALNFQLSIMLYFVVGIIAGIATVGFGFIIVGPLLLVLGIVWIVAPIVAAVKASNGEGFRYPVTIRFIAD